MDTQNRVNKKRPTSTQILTKGLTTLALLHCSSNVLQSCEFILSPSFAPNLWQLFKLVFVRILKHDINVECSSNTRIIGDFQNPLILHGIHTIPAPPWLPRLTSLVPDLPGPFAFFYSFHLGKSFPTSQLFRLWSSLFTWKPECGLR